MGKQRGWVRAGRFLAGCLILGGCAALPTTTQSPAPTEPSAFQPTTPLHTIATLTESTPSVEYPCTPDYCIQSESFPLSRPILPPANDRVDDTYRYGYTQAGVMEPHHGVEFNNPVGTPVHAAADGIVIYAGNDAEEVFGLYPNFYGNLVLLKHKLPGSQIPAFTLYGHLSSIAVATGDQVSSGEVIGEVGLTGSAIGAHLHFEVRLVEPEYSFTVNPELILSPLPPVGTSQPAGILAGRIVDQFGDRLNIPVSIQPFDPDGSLGVAIFPELYASGVPASPRWNENFLVSGLPPGKYRVAFVNYSKVFERTVEVIPGGVTFVKIKATP